MPHTQPHAAEFLARVALYRERVLAPSGLDLPAGALPRSSFFPEICVIEGPGAVGKFYGAGNAQWARNTVRASKLLQEAGVATPRILFSEVMPDAVRRHGLACILMERIEGRNFELQNLIDDPEPLAELLLRMHRLTSERWGALTWNAPCRDPEIFIVGQARQWLDELAPLESGAGLSPLTGVGEWFEHHAARLRPPEGRFHLSHNDLHETNLILSHDGTIHVIDLDMTGYGAIGLDLARLVHRPHYPAVAPGETRDALQFWEHRAAPFLETYLRMAPPSRRDLWQGTRTLCHVYELLHGYLHRLYAATPENCSDFNMTLPELLDDIRRRRSLIDALISA